MPPDHESILTTSLLFARIGRALVDDESLVRVEAQTVADQTVLQLLVAAQDVGKLVGKQGHTARSLRTILGAIGKCQGVRYSLDIVQPERD